MAVEGLNFHFFQWIKGSQADLFLKAFLNDDHIWEQQRTDECTRTSAIHALYDGSYLAVFYGCKTGTDAGFVMFVPKKHEGYEMHIGFKRGISSRNVLESVSRAVDAFFSATDHERIVAPCPDWNTAVVRIAHIIMRRYDRKSGHSISGAHRRLDFAVRDGNLYGATVVLLDRRDWEAIKRSKQPCH